MKYFYDAGGRADVGIDNPAALDIATIVLKARARHSVREARGGPAET